MKMPCRLICCHGLKWLKTRAGGDGEMLGKKERGEHTQSQQGNLQNVKGRYEWHLTKSGKVEDDEEKAKRQRREEDAKLKVNSNERKRRNKFTDVGSWLWPRFQMCIVHEICLSDTFSKQCSIHEVDFQKASIEITIQVWR